MSVTERDLRALFTSYGDLENNDGIILFRKDVPGYTNYAHINFNSRESATTAKSALNHTEFFGRLLRVEWNRSPKKFTEATTGINSSASSITTDIQVSTNSKNVNVPSSNNAAALIPTNGQFVMATTNDRGTYVCCPVLSVYVQFETIHEGARVSEATIRSLFEPFGCVTGKPFCDQNRF